MTIEIANRKSQIAKIFWGFTSGFTVVELTLYMGLLAIFLVVMTQIFVSSLDIQLESESTSAVQLDGSYILSRLSYDIARADDVATPQASGQTDQTLALIIGGETATYTLTNSVLTVDVGGQQIRLNSVDSLVSDLSFERGGNPGGMPTIRVVFTLTSVASLAKGPEVKSFQTTVSTR